MRRTALALVALAAPVAVLLPAAIAADSASQAAVTKSAVTPHPVAPCLVDAVAAGDFDGTAADIDKTAGRAVAIHPDVVMLLGDMAYSAGSTAQLKAGIGATRWTTLFGVAAPTPGNHDYRTANAADYFAYFDPPGYPNGAGGGHYYSFTLGCGWRGYSLDSEVAGSATWNAQLAWLKSDLAAHPQDKVVAIWHKPRYSSGVHGDNKTMAPLWDAFSGRTAIVLNGHDHDYERFAPKKGVQEFVVGTGGKSERGTGTVSSGSAYRLFSTPGVLRLMLSSTTYRWEFHTVSGSVVDQGGLATSHR